MSQFQKRRPAAKRHGAKNSGRLSGMARLARERALLAKAAAALDLPPQPFTPRPSPPSSPSLELRGGMRAARSFDDLDAEPPTLPSPMAASEMPKGGPEVPGKLAKARRMGRGKALLIALMMAAMASFALVRACDQKADPVEDDAAAPGSCSDDAAACVARA